MAPLVLLGPTGAGKSALALRLAECHGATIVSMDAMQVYRGMDIGTAKPTESERRRVPHAGIDLRDPDEAWSAADFVAMADAVSGPRILAGGTTFYFRAWQQGLVATPAADPVLRAELERLPDPHTRLQEVDPVLAARLHPNDRVRVIRGLEVFHATGTPLSALHAADAGLRRPAEVVWVDRVDLYEHIDRRVDTMMAEGYLDEVSRLLAAGYDRTLKPMRSLGYKHLAAHLAGELSLGEAVTLTKRDTRHFARRQRTFLRSAGFTPEGDADAAAQRCFGVRAAQPEPR